LELSHQQHFIEHGYAIIKSLARPEEIQAFRSYVEGALNPPREPLEYESDVGYLGAPAHRTETGGLTPRRLLQAYGRDVIFQSWARDRRIVSVLEKLLNERPLLSQAHHNCIMTKAPQYSSVTNWHQDIRYWSYERPELISVWLALGKEHEKNGCLWCLPKTHTMTFEPHQFDSSLFLKDDLSENKKLLSSAIKIELNPGDVLFFHSKLFHAAKGNMTHETKVSLVFSYHEANNSPLIGTKSAMIPSVEVS
jgi:phytanoyl-CoA hydroxylase